MLETTAFISGDVLIIDIMMRNNELRWSCLPAFVIIISLVQAWNCLQSFALHSFTRRLDTGIGDVITACVLVSPDVGGISDDVVSLSLWADDDDVARDDSSRSRRCAWLYGGDVRLYKDGISVEPAVSLSVYKSIKINKCSNFAVCSVIR